MITKEQFLMRQPSAPEVTSTDKYYFNLCNSLISIAEEKKLFPSYPAKVVERAALCLIGYYQDVICDAGVWRSFITENRRLYNKTLPFYETDDSYLDAELNRADVRFMVWYALSMNYEDLRIAYPLMEEICDGADAWWEELESVYDDSPMPEDYRLVHELEVHAPEDKEDIYKLGNWLYKHCYLMTPAFALTLSEMAIEFNLTTEEGIKDFKERLEECMTSEPTGPLALYLGEWLYLVIQGFIPERKNDEKKEVHKFYQLFKEATGGETIKFFDSYENLNRFLITGLGWTEGEEHLPQLKGATDYILKVDEKRGMLLARGVAKCIKAPNNPLYDKDFAQKNAIKMLTVRGFCPADLTKHCLKEGWLPDAVFPGTDDHSLVEKNADFIMRCYLQQYYRD